jgi:hypothetical protein
MNGKSIFTVTGALLLGATLAAQSPAPAKPAANPNAAKIRMAMSAAPSDISKNATIMDIDPTGGMKTLRKGTNGWTCMPSAGGAAGAAGADPMCFDESWMAWADAWMHKKTPDIKKMGVAYMLRGDKGASNTDPYAKEETSDNQWVVSPPHIMVLMPDAKQLDSFPTDPHAGGAWVMWKGTPYAHLMVPTSMVPAAAAPADKK